MSSRTWISWSSGKDSAFALHESHSQSDFEITGLLTTINEEFERVAMHGIREALLVRQAEELGFPLYQVKIPFPCSNETYESQMRQAITEAKSQGIMYMIFGDLFLEDIRAYREKMLEGTGVEPVFPIWKRPTDKLALEMIERGLKAVVTCVDPRKLPSSFAGRQFDLSFLKDLPSGIDPCGENGEFHTFCYAGPMFRNPLNVKVGETVERDGFVFADLYEVNQ